MVDLSVTIGGLTLANPVMPASGTFSPELARVIDLNRLGALVTKTITREFRAGNPTPRVAECATGMLNSIGIPSQGLDYFLNEIVPDYARFAPPLVASISAGSPEDFAALCGDVSVREVDAVEVNISCPNIEADGRSFANDPDLTEEVVRHLRAATAKPLWVKLSPNASDIPAVARAAERGGADALVVANTLLAMSIDIETFRPTLGSITGGLSGSAIKPVILRMVWQCARAVSIPVIGCGGIATADDAVEYMLAGASAVEVGTETFRHPGTMIEIIDGLAAASDLTGAVRDRDMETDEMEAMR